MPLESDPPLYAPPQLDPPKVKVDGFPVAVTSDVGVKWEMSDMGTGSGYQRRWTQEKLEAAAELAVLGDARDEPAEGSLEGRITR
jgi:hypothetical protein